MDTGDREAHPPSEESSSSPRPEATEWTWPAYPSDLEARVNELESDAPEDAEREEEPVEPQGAGAEAGAEGAPAPEEVAGGEEPGEAEEPAAGEDVEGPAAEEVEVEPAEADAVEEPAAVDAPAAAEEPEVVEPGVEEQADEEPEGEGEEPEPARHALVVRLEPAAAEVTEAPEAAEEPAEEEAEPSQEPQAPEAPAEEPPAEEAAAPQAPGQEQPRWDERLDRDWIDLMTRDEPAPAPAVDEPSPGDPATALAVRPDDVTLPIPVVTPIPPPPGPPPPVPALPAPPPPPPVRPQWPPPAPPPTWGEPRGWGVPARPVPAGRRRRGWIIALALLLTAALAVSLVALVPTLPGRRDSSTAAGDSRGAAASSPARQGGATAQTDPVTAAKPVLAARAAAVLHHDRAAFLATVDSRRASFYRAQAALYDRMITVPFSYLAYKVTAGGQDLASARLRSRYAPSPMYLLQVDASYRFRGQDSAPVTSRYYYTFVQTPKGWRIGGQGEIGGPRKGDVEIWDASPVRTLASSRMLVVYHAGDRSLAQRLLSAGERGYGQVDATWSAPWDHKVVILVPHDQDEAERLVHGRDLSDVAAVASSQVEQGPQHRVLGNRVIINSSVVRRYNTLNLQIVVTHEMTHVAARKIGVGVPLFLVEGFADYTALRPIDAPLRITRPALRAAVRAGRFKGKLPSDDDLQGGDATLAYDEGSSFCLWIERTFGAAKVQSLYRSFAGMEDPTAEDLDQRLRQVLGISRGTAESRWAAFVRQAF